MSEIITENLTKKVFLINQHYKKGIYGGFYYCLLFTFDEKFEIKNISEEFALEKQLIYDKKRKSIKIEFGNGSGFDNLNIKLKNIYGDDVKIFNVSNKFI